MLVIILSDPSVDGLEKLTVASVTHTAPQWEIEVVTGDYGAHLNRRLKTYSEPFFILLHAGELITSRFAAELPQWVMRLPERGAGYYIRSPGDVGLAGAGREPVIWKTAAIRTGELRYFWERDEFPFDRLTALCKAAEVSRSWSWHRLESEAIDFRQVKMPAWLKNVQERSVMAPILNHYVFPPPKPAGGNAEFSVVLSTYNNGNYVLWAIRSVLAQTFPHWELLVIDDGSIDHTLSQLAGMPPDPRIRIVTGGINRGKSECLNTALRLASGRWLVELDADDWLQPDCLETFLKAAEEQESMGSLGALYGDFEEWIERRNRQLLYHRRQRSMPEFCPRRLLDEAIPLAPRCYKTEALRSIGGWGTDDPYGGRLYEDFSMLIRLSKKYRLVHVPVVLYHRRMHAASVTRRHSDRYAAWKSWALSEL